MKYIPWVLARENAPEFVPYTVSESVWEMQKFPVVGNAQSINAHFLGFPNPGNLRFLPVKLIKILDSHMLFKHITCYRFIYRRYSQILMHDIATYGQYTFSYQLQLATVFPGVGHARIPVRSDILSQKIFSGRTEFHRKMCPPDTFSCRQTFSRHRIFSNPDHMIIQLRTVW